MSQSTVLFRGLKGTLTNYQLNIINVLNEMSITDNFSSNNIISPYGFSNNSFTIPYPRFNSNPPKTMIWPISIPIGSSFTSDSTKDACPPLTDVCNIAMLNNSPTPSSGIFNSLQTYNFQIYVYKTMYPNQGNIFTNVQINPNNQVNIEPIAFLLDVINPQSSKFFLPTQITTSDILTLTMPIMYPTLSGLINNLTWSVSLQTPINTIIPQSSFDINGNYTAWLPNYGIGNYTLIATCNENYYASPEFRISYSVVDTPLTTIKGENITKYKKLIKHSKNKPKNK